LWYLVAVEEGLISYNSYIMDVHTTHVSLLQALAAGNQSAAWRDFSERYGELIRVFARGRGLQTADCDDVVQDVLIELTRQLPSFEYDAARGRFRGFLKTITLHIIYKRFRRVADRIRPEALDTQIASACDDPTIDQTWEAEWRNYHVRQAMQTIDAEFNENDRLAFQQYAVSGQDAKRTAESLGLTIEQVYQAKSRITRRLSELIEAQISEEG
jgi:RNA polymerase sigma-70 factor (ECF subfamily)